MLYNPMPLVRVEGAFDHPTSRRGHPFTKFKLLAEEIAYSVRAAHAVLDGEIVCLDADGRSNFYSLLFRREWPYFAGEGQKPHIFAVDGRT